jgi:F-type H+-transporting ATPase subunit b
MNINATLFGQMITFAIFVWFTVKFVWPLLHKALETRKQRIADGLQAAEKGHRDLELAEHKAAEMLKDAQQEIEKALAQSHKEGDTIIQQAKQKALALNQHERDVMKTEFKQHQQQLKTQLQTQTASLVIDCAEKFIKQKFDEKKDALLIDKIIAEINQA